MSLNVTFRQLQKHLNDIIDRAVNENEVRIIDRGGVTYAVIVSGRKVVFRVFWLGHDMML